MAVVIRGCKQKFVPFYCIVLAECTTFARDRGRWREQGCCSLVSRLSAVKKEKDKTRQDHIVISKAIQPEITTAFPVS